MNESIEKIVVELTRTPDLIRWPCDACGGSTEKVPVLAEVIRGEHKGFRVCEECLKSGDVKAEISRHVERLGKGIAYLKGLLRCKWTLPTYDAWLHAVKRGDPEGFLESSYDSSDGDLTLSEEPPF
jgi:hypothetical protein